MYEDTRSVRRYYGLRQPADGAQHRAGLRVRSEKRAQRLRHLATSSAPGEFVELVPRRANVGAKAKTPPFARGLHYSRRSDGDKMGRDTLRFIRHQTKACDGVIPPCGLVQLRGPRVIRPIVTGPARPP
jgi:hypothetical protein